MGKRYLLMAAGVVALLLALGALLFMLRGDGARADGTSSRLAEELTYDDFLSATGKRPRGGVAARQADPAVRVKQVQGGWMMGHHPEAIELAKDPLDLDDLVRQDKEKWESLQTWKLSHGGSSPYGVARHYCMVRELKGKLTETCDNDVSVVLKSTTGNQGEVVFVQSRLSDDAPGACVAYSECVAERGWLGRSAPMPDGETLLAVKAGDMLIPFDGTPEERRDLLERQLDGTRQQLQEWRERDDAALAQQIQLFEDMVEFYEWALQESG